MCEEDNGEKLRSFAENGNYEMVEAIIKQNKVDINSKDSDGYSALHRACYEGQVEIARLLITSGANIELKTNDGWTPLHSACRWNKVQTASYLIHKGADVNARTNGNQTPLHIATSCKDTKNILTLLLWTGKVNLEIKNAAGDTAYDIARRTSENYKLFENLI